jgi:hypothetical protein
MEQFPSAPGHSDRLGEMTSPHTFEHPEQPDFDGLEDQTRVAKAIVELLTSRESAERSAAARELGSLGNTAASSYLIAALSDPDIEVCQAAAVALGQLGDYTALGPLNEFLANHTDESLIQFVQNSIHLILGRDQHGLGNFSSSSPADNAIETNNLDILDFPDEVLMEDVDSFTVKHEIARLAAEMEAREQSHSESARLAQLEVTKVKAHGEAKQQSSREAQIKSELDEIRRAQAQQLKRIEEAEAARISQEKTHKELEVQANRVADEEKQRLARLEQMKTAAEFESFERANTAKNLTKDLETLKQTESSQRQRLDEVNSFLSGARDTVRELEAKINENQEVKRKLSEEIEHLRQTEASQRETISTDRHAIAVRESQLQQIITEQTIYFQKSQALVTALESKQGQLQLESKQNAAAYDQLNRRIEAMIRAEADQLTAMADASARLTAQERSREILRGKLREQSEKEQLLNTELEQLHKVQAEQYARLSQAENLTLTIQAEAKEASEQEAKLRAEAEKLRLAEIEARRTAADQMRRETEAELEQHAREQEQHLAELEAIQIAAAKRTNQLAEAERKLNLEIASLKETENAQAQLLSGVKARQHAAEDRVREYEFEVERWTTKEHEQAVQLENLTAQAEVDAQKRAEYIQELNARIERSRQVEAEQLHAIANTESQISANQHQQKQLEETIREGLEREQSLSVELQTLKTTEAAVLERITVAEEQLLQIQTAALEAEEREETLLQEAELTRKKEAEARKAAADKIRLQTEAELRRRAQDQERQLAALGELREEAKLEAAKRAEVGKELNKQIESLKKVELEQLKSIAEAEVHVQRLDDERGRKEDQLRQLGLEAADRVVQLEAIRQKLELEAEHRAGTENALKAGIEILRGAEEKQLRQIETAKSQLREAEVQARQQAEQEVTLKAQTEAIRKAEAAARKQNAEEMLKAAQAEVLQREAEDQKNLEELDTVRRHGELAARERAERADELNGEIEALRRAEAEDLRRLAEFEARRLDHEEAYRQVQTEISEKGKEEQQRITELETIRRRAEAKTMQQAATHRNLLDVIDALDKEKVLLDQKSEEAQAGIRQAQADAIHQVEEAERMRAAAITLHRKTEATRQLAAHTLREETEANLRSQAEAEEKRIAELEAIRATAEQDSLLRAERESALLAEIEKLQQAKVVEQKRLDEANVRLQDQQQQFAIVQAQVATETKVQKQHLAALETLRANHEEELKKQQEVEHALNVDIEAVRLATVNQTKAVGELQHELEQVQTEADLAKAEEARLSAELSSLEESEVEARKQAAIELEEQKELINEQVERLQKQLAEQSEQLARAEELKTELEAKAEQLTVDLQAKADEEQQRLASLEAMHLEAVNEMIERSATAEKLQLEIESLSQASFSHESEIEALRSEIERLEIRAQEQVAEEQRLKEEIDAQCQAEAEARREAANERHQLLEAENSQREREELFNLTQLQAFRDEAERQSQKRSESEQKLQVEIAALTLAEVEQVRLLAEAVATLNEQRQSEAHRSAELELLNDQAKTRAEELAETEKVLRAELEALQAEEAEQRERIAAVESELSNFTAECERLKAEEESQRIALEQQQATAAEEAKVRFAEELKARAEAEAANLAQLEAMQAEAELKSQKLQEKELELQISLEESRAAAEQQANQIEALGKLLVQAQSQLSEQVATETRMKSEFAQLQQNAEIAVQYAADRAWEIECEIQVLKSIEADQVARLIEAETELSTLKANISDKEQTESAVQTQLEKERVRLASEGDERLGKLQSALEDATMAAQASSRYEEKLKEEVARMRADEAAQSERVESLRNELTQLQKETVNFSDEEARLKEAAEALRKSMSSDKRMVLDYARAEVEAEAQKVKQLEEAQLHELEALREKAQVEAQERAEREDQLNSELKALKLAKTRQLRRLEKLEARFTEEAAAGQKTAGKRTKAGSKKKTEADKFTVLAGEVEGDIIELSSKEVQLNRQIEELYQEEMKQIAKVEQLKAQVRDRKVSVQTATESVASLEAALLEASVSPVNVVVEVASQGVGYDEYEVTSEQPTLDEFVFNSDFEIEVELNDPVPSNQTQTKLAEGDSYVILQFDPTEVEAAPVQEETETVSTPEVEFVSNNEEVNHSAIDVVRQEKGIDVVSEEGGIPAALLERLSSEDANERVQALAEVTQFAGDEAFGLISKAFDDPSVAVRSAAARSMSQLDKDRAVSFTRALRETTPEGRRRIGAALASSGLAGEAINRMVGGSREEMYDAFSILFLMAKAGEIQPLLKAIEEHQEISVRLAVVSLIAFSEQVEAIPAFRKLAVRASLPTEVRSAVMEAIHQMTIQARDSEKSAA